MHTVFGSFVSDGPLSLARCPLLKAITRRENVGGHLDQTRLAPRNCASDGQKWTGNERQSVPTLYKSLSVLTS